MNALKESQKAALEQERHSIQMQMLECQTALDELQNTTQAYKVVGNLLIAKDSKQLRAEIQAKQKALAAELSALSEKEKSIG
ncbi:MAG TPA: prefoldin subunit [Acidobacteriota bacterium]|nr:prefoldin subunit [Acidobacteriota bacterium]